MLGRHFFIILLCCCVFFGCEQKSWEERVLDGLEITLQAKEHVYKTGETVRLEFSIKNNLGQDVYLIKSQNPFARKLGADLFHVIHHEKQVAYKGEYVDNPNLTEKDYMRISPNVSCGIGVNLSRHYQIDKPGEYTIKFSGSLKVAQFKNHAYQNYRLASEPITVTIIDSE